MKRQSNTSDHDQKKISRNADRSSGRAGLHAADEKSAKAKQHGNPFEMQKDKAHLQANHRNQGK